MSSRLVIVGGGGFGREVHAWVSSSPRWCAAHRIQEIVSIDDSVPNVEMPVPIISTISGFQPMESDIGICAIGSPVTRRGIVEQLESRGLVFPAFTHDTATIGVNIALADGVIVCPMAILSCDIVVERHSHINCGCTVGHDVTIGEFTTLSSSCNLTGAVSVGSDSFLGTAVTVIPGVSLGAESYVGAGSVVVRNVAEGARVFGNPALRIGGSS